MQQPSMCASEIPKAEEEAQLKALPRSSNLSSLKRGPFPFRLRCGHPLQEEAQRLRAILGAFPTTEDEDRDTLANGDVTDWRARTIIDFRIRRKEALRLAVQRIEAALNTDKAADVSTDSSTGSATAQDSAEASAQSSSTRMTSGVKYDGQVPDATAAEDVAESAGLNNAAAEPDSLQTSLEELGSEEGTQDLEHVPGARKAVVRPVEGASEDLQEPKFIKIGSPAVDEL